MANIIVLESARARGIDVGFRQYLRLGVPITILTTAVALTALLCERWLFVGQW